MHPEFSPSSELLTYSFRSVLVALGYSQRFAGFGETPAIPESFKNDSEKVLVNFVYWSDANFSKNMNAHDMALAIGTAFVEIELNEKRT